MWCLLCESLRLHVRSAGVRTLRYCEWGEAASKGVGERQASARNSIYGRAPSTPAEDDGLGRTVRTHNAGIGVLSKRSKPTGPSPSPPTTQ